MKHALLVFDHFMVPEPQDFKAQILEHGRSALIGVSSMLPAVEFDDQAYLAAQEVYNKRSDRRLSSKLEARQLAIAQRLPKALFDFGSVTSKRTCMGVGATDGCHGGSITQVRPSPNPLPLAGEGFRLGASRQIEEHVLQVGVAGHDVDDAVAAGLDGGEHVAGVHFIL